MDPQTQIPQQLPPEQPPFPEGSEFMPEYDVAPPSDPRPPQVLISLVVILFLSLTSVGLMMVGDDTGTYVQVVVTSVPLSKSTIYNIPSSDELATDSSSTEPTPTDSFAPTDAPTPTDASTPTTSGSTGPIPKKSTTPTPTHSVGPSPTTTPKPSTSPSPTPSPTPTKPPSGYNNGTYSASVRYSVPGSTEPIGVTVVLSNGIVSDVSITQNPTNGTSAYYQNAFANNYKSLVVGKSIKTLSLGRVSGASLTPNGFNSAIASIRSKATA